MLQRVIVAVLVHFGGKWAGVGVPVAAAMAWGAISYRRCSVEYQAKMLDSSNYGQIPAPYE